MTPSDFLTFLGLGIAAWAIIAANERRFIGLFFSKAELLSGLVLIAFIHYLLAFDWMQHHWFSGLSVFTVKNGVPAGTWAYVCALLLLGYPIGRISFGFFSMKRLEALIGLYETLLERGDIDLLIRYLMKYHVADVQRFLESYEGSTQMQNQHVDRMGGKPAPGYHTFFEEKRAAFAEAVYDRIITREEFVRRAANINPGLFARVIKGMQHKDAANRDFVKLYLGCLFEHKNAEFIKELKTVNGARDAISERVQHVALPILEAVLVNTEVAAENYVWYSIGQEARKGMHYDSQQLTFLIQEYDEQLEPELWQQKIFIAIVFFNYMVRETIYRESGWHMWLFYYQRFVDLLIRNNMPEVVSMPGGVGKKRGRTFNEHLIENIVGNILDWFDLAVDEDTEGQSIDAAKCLGEILADVADSSDFLLNDAFKVEILDRVLSRYFELSKHKNSEIANWTRTHLEGMFRNPKNPDWSEAEYTAGYQRIFEKAWKGFDKVPYQGAENNGSILRFTKDVLDHLGISGG